MNQEPNLFELFHKYGTDKAEYAPLYQLLFRTLRHSVHTVLEIGIGTMNSESRWNMIGWAEEWYKPGGSLRAWRDYFPNAHIFGLDIEKDTMFSEERISTHICNSTDPTSVNGFVTSVNFKKFDVIIDDGSHYGEDQILTMKNLVSHLRNDGIYIIEDIAKDNPLLQQPEKLTMAVPSMAFFFVGIENNIIVGFKNECKIEKFHQIL